MRKEEKQGEEEGQKEKKKHKKGTEGGLPEDGGPMQGSSWEPVPA